MNTAQPNYSRILTEGDLARAVKVIGRHASHDDRLFVAMVWTGYYGQLHLSDLLSTHHTPTSRETCTRSAPDEYTIVLPVFAQVDRLCQRSVTVTIGPRYPQALNPYFHFTKYIHRRDRLFPYHVELWLLRSGERPTRAWFRMKWAQYLAKPCTTNALRGWYVLSTIQLKETTHTAIHI